MSSDRLRDRGLAIGYYLPLLRAAYPSLASSTPDWMCHRIRQIRAQEKEFYTLLNRNNYDALVPSMAECRELARASEEAHRAHLKHRQGRGASGSDTIENTRIMCFHHHIELEHTKGLKSEE